MPQSNILMYTTEDGVTKIEVTFDQDTVWLSIDQMAELFQRDKSVIGKHIRNIFKEGELIKEAVWAKFAYTASDGKTYQVDFYNLDVIISVGYRVKSLRGTQFRIWAASILKEYMKKGFALDDDRLKNLGGGNYFDELLARIRDIRSSEKVFWRKVLALTEFLVRKTGYRWDAVPIDNVSVGDLDIESFEIFRREAVRTERMTRKDLECTNEELLNKLGLIVDGKLKRAAVLLFYRNPQRFFTGCYVKIGKFGIGSDLQYQDVVEGSLILIADRVVELIYLKYLKASISYDKEVRVETYPYAREAVREAVYNALIHCKWEDGIPIQIRIEDEAMYISNACVFPSDWTTENLMKTHNSRPYNPDLANTFFRAGYIESWGRGIQKICEECNLIGAKIPEYSILGDDITVKFTAVANSKDFNRTNDVRKGKQFGK